MPPAKRLTRRRAPARKPWRKRTLACRGPPAALAQLMILVDTSVWVDHLSAVSARLAGLLKPGAALGHPSVLGELALGNIGNRAEVVRSTARCGGVPTRHCRRRGLIGRSNFIRDAAKVCPPGQRRDRAPVAPVEGFECVG